MGQGKDCFSDFAVKTGKMQLYVTVFRLSLNLLYPMGGGQKLKLGDKIYNFIISYFKLILTVYCTKTEGFFIIQLNKDKKPKEKQKICGDNGLVITIANCLCDRMSAEALK